MYDIADVEPRLVPADTFSYQNIGLIAMNEFSTSYHRPCLVLRTVLQDENVNDFDSTQTAFLLLQ